MIYKIGDSRIGIQFQRGQRVSPAVASATVQIIWQEACFSFYGDFEIEEVRNFLELLRRAHENLKGVAKLVDLDYLLEVDFRYLGGPENIFVIGGKLGSYDIVGLTHDNLKSKWLYRSQKQVGVELAFDGIAVDQSYLPDIIRNLEELFLREDEVE